MVQDGESMNETPAIRTSAQRTRRTSLPVWSGLGKERIERQAELLHLDLVRTDEIVLVVALEAPVVGPFAVEDAAAFDGDVDEVLAVEEGVLVEAGFVVEGIDRGSGLDEEADVAAEVDRPARVLAGRDEHRAASGRGAGVDGLLDGFLGQVLFDPGRAEILDVEDQAETGTAPPLSAVCTRPRE